MKDYWKGGKKCRRIVFEILSPFQKYACLASIFTCSFSIPVSFVFLTGEPLGFNNYLNMAKVLSGCEVLSIKALRVAEN